MVNCPSCGSLISLSDISDADLKSERGRRNAARRKSVGARRKGQRQVWKRHNPAARACRCPQCLIRGVKRLEHALEARIQRRVGTVGAEPDWATAERQRLRKLRSEIEWAILDQQLDASGSAGSEQPAA